MDFYFSADFDDGYGSSSFGLNDFENGSHYLVFFFFNSIEKEEALIKQNCLKMFKLVIIKMEQNE